MDPAPAKRRKISPSSSTAVTAQNTQTRPVSQDGESSSSRRASFMSPTKASLARFNPSLLPPLKPAESQRPSSRGPDIQNRGTRDGLNGGAVRQSGQEAVTHERTPKPSLGANGTGLRATPRRRSRTPGEHDTSLRNARSAVPQSPRASPPDEGREEGNGVQVIQVEGDTRAAGGHNSIFQEASAPLVPATGPGSRQPITPRFPGLPRLSSGMGQSDDGEPSLPSTPVHLGIEKPPERAKGLLFSSPSRRPRRHGTSSVKSSPLKPQAPVPDLSVARPPHVYTFLGPQTYIPNTPRPPFTAEEVEQRNMRETLARLEKQLQEIEGQVTRHVLVSKWQEGDRRGVKELSKRTKEVLQKSAKIIRSREELGKRQIQEGTGSVDQEMVDASALRNDTLALPSPLSLIHRLDRFLPFSRLPPGRHASQDLDASQQLNADDSQDSVAPFTITTTNALLLPSIADNALQERQDLTMSAPRQLLRAKLQITINIASQSIDQLRILGMSPWADGELGGWLRALPVDSNLSVIGTAFGRYYEMCRDRAQCFLEAEQELKVLLTSRRIVDGPEHLRLSTYLGRQDVSFARDHVGLDVTWLVSFNDDGETESRVTAKARLPDTWRRTVGAELDKIGDAFELLVKEKGALEAILVVCRLMFPA